MAINNEMKVIFWGTTGSGPAPRTSAQIQEKIAAAMIKAGKEKINLTSLEEVRRFISSLPWHECGTLGGNTACVEVMCGDTRLVLDMGSGFRNLGKKMITDFFQRGINPEAIILLSHLHTDHIEGLPLSAPPYFPNSRLSIFGPLTFDTELFELLARSTMHEPNFPFDFSDLASINAFRNIQSFNENHVIVVDRNGNARKEVSFLYQKESHPEDVILIGISKFYAHPKLGVFNFRISFAGKTFVYATDIEMYPGGDERLRKFSEGADLMIVDSQFTWDDYRTKFTGWGHNSGKMAGFTGRHCGAKRLALTHFSPNYTDAQILAVLEEAQEEFPGAFVAYEGLEVII